MNFYVGLDDLYYAHRFDRVFISVNRLRDRRSHFNVGSWIMDSGAFTEISQHGRYRSEPEEYAAEVERWKDCGNLEMAVTQDWMCEPFILAKTGRTVKQHQDDTVERYQRIQQATSVPVMPVLQGFEPNDYMRQIDAYGTILKHGARCGVGSVCKRNNHPQMIEYILRQIKAKRPDLQLHGFGLKITALQRPCIRALLQSADSMAWSDDARKKAHAMIRELQAKLDRKVMPAEAREIMAARGISMPNAHDWRTAARFVARIEGPTAPLELWNS